MKLPTPLLALAAALSLSLVLTAQQPPPLAEPLGNESFGTMKLGDTNIQKFRQDGKWRGTWNVGGAHLVGLKVFINGQWVMFRKSNKFPLIWFSPDNNSFVTFSSYVTDNKTALTGKYEGFLFKDNNGNFTAGKFWMNLEGATVNPQ